MKKIRLVLIMVAAFFVVFCADSEAAKKEKASKKGSKSDIASVEAARKYNMSMTYEVPSPFPLFDTGDEEWIDYSRYGEFQGVDTEKYKYVIKDIASLRKAVGEGIYPNTQSVYKDPGYIQYNSKQKLKGDKWAFVNTNDYQANFYKWATAQDTPGVKLYYTAYALDMAGNYKHAIKAYYAILVHFPEAVGMTFWKTPWYVGPVCVDRIKYLTKEHPELGIKLEGAYVKVKNRYDNDKNNDVFIVNPGKLVPATKKDFEVKTIDLSKVGIKKVTGTGNVQLIEFENKHFQLTVDGKPFVVRGVCYSPNQVGLSPDNGTLNVNRDWSVADYNKNNLVDGAYEAWVDANRNERQDPDEKAVGDFKLMKDMGINTLRLYHYPDFNKELLKDGYENYGFMYMVGNMLGMYGVASGAAWFEGTDYTNPEHKKNMLDSVRAMVEEYKDEPYVLMWVLGNENNYGSVGVEGVEAGTSCQARYQPEAYYSFINECVLLIKSLDPQQRPVTICNGDTFLMDHCAKNAPDLDIYGANAYRGEQGFGSLWQDVMDEYGKPVVVTEFGCPAYHSLWETARAEAGQASYHRGNWLDMENNFAGIKDGVGNALGGIIFEWTDEWWKAGPPPEFDPWHHDTTSQFGAPFLDGYSYEEWFGICSVGDGKDSPFKRQLRPAYFTYRDLWEKYKKNK